MSNEKILNPKTNRMVSINSKLGRKIKAEEEVHVLVDAIIQLKEIDSIIPAASPLARLQPVEEVINIIDVNEEDVKKFEELSISNKEYVIKIDDYMNEHNEKNSDKIINVNIEDEKDDQKTEEGTNEVNEIDVFKVIMDKKEYMKKYYEANRDKIINQTRTRYKKTHEMKEKKEPIDKKDYMKNYYKQNKDKIKERSHDRYKIKKEISVFTDKINERLE
jgi:hypothetical protein